MRLRSHRSAVGVALLVTLLWSSSWVLIRWGLEREDLPPISFAALRYGLAALFLVGWLAYRRPRHRWQPPDRSMVVRLVLLGVVAYALTQGALFVALAEQPAATTSLVLSLTPLLVALVAAVSLAEVPTRWQLAGTVLVALGAWLYFAGELGATLAGMVAAAAALAANVASSLLARDINRSRRLPAVVVTALSMAVGAVVLVIVGLVTEGLPTVSTTGWLIIVWLALVNTALAFTLWNLSLRRLSALESAAVNNTMLVQIAVLAWLFLGESPGLPALLGILLVSAGVYVVQVAGRSAPSGEDSRTAGSTGR